jgi:hypothetical protein
MQSYCDLIKLLHAASGAALKGGQEKQLALTARRFTPFNFYPQHCAVFINPRVRQPFSA